MSEKKLYALTDAEASEIKDRYTQYGIDEALDREEVDLVLDEADRLFIPLDMDDAIERMARAIADLEPGEPWPTNEELGGGPTGTRDDEYRHDCMDRARFALGALLQEDEWVTHATRCVRS